MRRFLIALTIGFLGGLPILLLAGMIKDWGTGLYAGLIAASIAGTFHFFIIGISEQIIYSQNFLIVTKPYQRFKASIWFLHFSILQHFHLRWLLYRQGLFPWKLVKFLKEATKHHILESDGGSWRFRHRILQDYFARHWKEHYAEKYDPSSNS